MSMRDKTSSSTPEQRRSDEIRRRRMAQSHAGQQKEQRRKPAILGGAAARSASRRRAVSAGAPPPVMARGSGPRLAPTGGKRDSKTRRLYNVSLSAPGAEMRLPSLPRLGLSWRAASLFLLAFLVAILYYFWTAPGFQVEEAQISGLKRMTRGDVNKALALSGTPVFTLDSGQIQNDLLESFPEFSQVAARIELPNTLAITVTERVPVLIWRQEGVSNLVDSEGMTFPARDEASLSAYPVIEASGDPPLLPGVEASLAADAPASLALEKILTDSLALGLPVKGEATSFLSPETVTALLQIIDQAPTSARVIYEPGHGYGWEDSRGWKVFLGQITPGTPTQIETKLQVYRAILDQVKAAGAKPTLISVEFLHVPYYQLEPSE